MKNGFNVVALKGHAFASLSVLMVQRFVCLMFYEHSKVHKNMNLTKLKFVVFRKKEVDFAVQQGTEEANGGVNNSMDNKSNSGLNGSSNDTSEAKEKATDNATTREELEEQQIEQEKKNVYMQVWATTEHKSLMVLDLLDKCRIHRGRLRAIQCFRCRQLTACLVCVCVRVYRNRQSAR